MKDRFLLVLAGVLCAGLAWLAWSRFPSLTMCLIVLGPVVGAWQEQRRAKRLAADGIRHERQRQLQRLTGTLGALRDRHGTTSVDAG